MIDSLNKIFFKNSEKSAAEKHVFSKGGGGENSPPSRNKGLICTALLIKQTKCTVMQTIVCFVMSSGIDS